VCQKLKPLLNKALERGLVESYFRQNFVKGSVVV
jgi:hypothetical protein